MGASVATIGFTAWVLVLGKLLPKRELTSVGICYRFAAGAAVAIVATTFIPSVSMLALGSDHTVGAIRLAIIAAALPSAYLFTLNNRGPLTGPLLGGMALGVLLGAEATSFAYSIHTWFIILAAAFVSLAPTRSAFQRTVGCVIAAVALISAPSKNPSRLIGGDLKWSEAELVVGAVSFAREGASSPDEVERLTLAMNESERLYTSISNSGTSAVYLGRNQQLVTILDGFVHQSNSRASDSLRLTPHIGAALTPETSEARRALVIGDHIGVATEGLILQGFTDISVSVPNPAPYRALAELSPAFEATMLNPSVKLKPNFRGHILAATNDLDLIIESASTPWHDSFQGIPTPSQLQIRSDRLSANGTYILSFELGWLRVEQLKSLIESFSDTFSHSWIFLPPNGGDQMIVAGWSRDTPPQWDSLVEATARGSSILSVLDINSPMDLADRAAFKITEDLLPTFSSSIRPAYSITGIKQRPQMLWPLFTDELDSPSAILEADLDTAITNLLDQRLDSNRAFLRLLETTSSGEMNEMFEASRELQNTAAGDRALDPLIAPYLSRARELIERAATAGPTSELWGQAQGEIAAALLLHPNSVEGAIISAEVSLGVGQTNAANSNFNRALELDPTSASAALGVAQVAMIRRDLPKAERTLNRARDYHPLNWLIAYNLGLINKEKGDTARAEELLREAAALSEELEVLPHTALAELYLLNGEPTRALVEASRAMAISPSAHHSYIQGKAYYEVEQYEQSERAFQQAVLGDPELWQARAGLGLIYAIRGDYPRCVSAFTDVISASPNNPMAIENRDRCSAALD